MKRGEKVGKRRERKEERKERGRKREERKSRGGERKKEREERREMRREDREERGRRKLMRDRRRQSRRGEKKTREKEERKEEREERGKKRGERGEEGKPTEQQLLQVYQVDSTFSSCCYMMFTFPEVVTSFFQTRLVQIKLNKDEKNMMNVLFVSSMGDLSFEPSPSLPPSFRTVLDSVHMFWFVSGSRRLLLSLSKLYRAE